MPTIHQDEGEFHILTPINVIAEQNLTIEAAGRTCYKSDIDNITQESADKFIKMMWNCSYVNMV